MLFPATENKLTGFIDETGEFVVEPRFDGALRFSEDTAAAKSEYHWGFIDRTGAWVIAPTLSMCSPFSDGLSAVSIAGEKAYIDPAGTVALPGPFYKCDDFNGGIACVQRDRMDSGTLINNSGVQIGEAVFPLSTMVDGLINCTHNRKWGYADGCGDFKIAPKYESAYPFSEGLAAVADTGNGHFYFIDTSGDVAISKTYQGVELKFSQGLCPIWDKAAGYIDRSGNIQIQPQFKIAHPFSDGLAAVMANNGLFGYINLVGELTIPAQFTIAEPFIGGLAAVGIGPPQAPSLAYINRQGEYVWGPSP